MFEIPNDNLFGTPVFDSLGHIGLKCNIKCELPFLVIQIKHISHAISKCFLSLHMITLGKRGEESSKPNSHMNVTNIYWLQKCKKIKYIFYKYIM